MPIVDPTAVTTLKVEGNIDTIAGLVQTALRDTLAANDEIFDISYIRSQHSQGVVAIISYEAAP